MTRGSRQCNIRFAAWDLIIMAAAMTIIGCQRYDPRLRKERYRRYSIDQYNKGLDQEKEGNLSSALVFYRRSLNASPRPGTYYHIGYIYSEQGDYIQAKGFLKKALEENENFELARLELEKVKLALGDQYESVNSNINIAAVGEPRSKTTPNLNFFPVKLKAPLPPMDEVEANLFPRLQARGEVDDMEEERRLYTYTLAHKITMPSAEFHRRKAEEYALRGLLNEAIYEYRDTLSFDPNDVRARIGLARVYERVGRYKPAEEELLKVVEANPTMSMAAFQAGNFYFRQSIFEQAADMYKKAVAIQPENRAALNNLAASQIKIGDYEDARITLNTLIEIDPRFLNAHLNLGILYDDHLKEPDKALYHYNQYLELGGADSEKVQGWITRLEAAQSP